MAGGSLADAGNPGCIMVCRGGFCAPGVWRRAAFRPLPGTNAQRRFTGLAGDGTVKRRPGARLCEPPHADGRGK
jgi:hypothetical protein